MTGNGQRILTTHVGSLPRPDPLRDLLASGGRSNGDEFAERAAEAVRAVVERQANRGIDIGNDGEQARPGFISYVTDRLEGYGGEAETGPWADLADFPSVADAFSYGTGVFVRPAATEPVRYAGVDRLRFELETFDEALDDRRAEFVDTFMTAASPGILSKELPNGYYDSRSEYVFQLAEALRPEYEAIVDAGHLLQLDAPDLLSHGHRSYADRPLAEYKEAIRNDIDALNHAITNVPKDRIRLHTCWGNYPGPHHRDTPLATMLPIIYEANVGTLLVEQSTPGHQHEFRAFEEHPLPDGMTLAPGVIDVKSNMLEHPVTVADRIERVVDVVGDPTRVQAAPDCGFGTTPSLENVHPELVWEKLGRLSEGAEIATSRVF